MFLECIKLIKMVCSYFIEWEYRLRDREIWHQRQEIQWRTRKLRVATDVTVREKLAEFLLLRVRAGRPGNAPCFVSAYHCLWSLALLRRLLLQLICCVCVWLGCRGQ